MDGQTLNDGAPLPVPTDARWFKIISPVGLTPLRVVILADTFTGYWTHWNGAPTPCWSNDECPHCKAGLGNRWTGYAACYSLTHKREAIVALSEGAARALLPVLKKDGSLRGQGVELVRRLPRPNAPVHVNLMKREPLEKCPPCFDITSSLHRLWGVSADFIGRGKKRLARRDDYPPDNLAAVPYKPRIDHGKDDHIPY